jgi:hypothetical protein
MKAIELHELTEDIKEKTGEVLDLSTDAVTCCFPDSTEFPLEFPFVDGGWNEFERIHI